MLYDVSVVVVLQSSKMMIWCELKIFCFSSCLFQCTPAEFVVTVKSLVQLTKHLQSNKEVALSKIESPLLRNIFTEVHFLILTVIVQCITPDNTTESCINFTVDVVIKWCKFMCVLSRLSISITMANVAVVPLRAALNIEWGKRRGGGGGCLNTLC